MPVGFAARGPLALSAEYDPDADGGLKFWFDVRDTAFGPRISGGAYAANGQTTEQLHCSAGSGFNFEAVGTGPQFQDNSLNAYPGTYAAAGYYKTVSGLQNTLALNASVFSYFQLMKLHSGSSAFGRLMELVGTGQTQAYDNIESFTILTTDSTSHDLTYQHNLLSNNTSSTAFDTAYVSGIIFNGSTFQPYLNGAALGSPVAQGGSLGNPTINFLVLQNAVTSFYECFGTTTDLTGQVSAVQAYFQTKWGPF